MKIFNKITEQYFLTQIKKFDVADEYKTPLVNFILYGLHPGSGFYALYVNNAYGFISHSHPSNCISNLKLLVNLLVRLDFAVGNKEKVDAWLKSDEETRRKILETEKLILSLEEEVLVAMYGLDT